MELMHRTYQTADHARGVTLCGIQFTTDKTYTRQVQSTGQWVTCPLCELRQTLIDTGLEPDPRTRPNQWIQPTFEEALQWT